MDDHCDAIWSILDKGQSGEEYNVGGGTEVTNLDICHQICAYLDEIMPKETSYKDQISYVKDRYGHDFRYSVDCTKINNQLDWSAKKDFNSSLKDTTNWFVEYNKK